MTARKIASGLAALALAGSVVVSTATLASAQENPGASKCNSANRTSGQTGTGPSVADQNAERGQRQAASSGCARFAPGRQVEVGVRSTYQVLGTTTANQFGEATFAFTVPTNLANGPHEVVFTDTANRSNVVTAGFVVNGGPFSGAATGQNRNNARVAGVLPRTGADSLVPLGIGGGVLVLAGAGIVVAARRRSNELPGSAA